MDDGEININPEDINRLSDREKRELQIFLQGETQKAQVQKRMDPPLSIKSDSAFRDVLLTDSSWVL
jgi:hypothetical protein